MPLNTMSKRTRSRTAHCAALILLSLATRQLIAQNPTQDHAGQYAQADIAYGSQLYAAQCATCHGASGDAVGGVNLRSGQIRRASTDQELQRLITAGIPGTGMPNFRSLTPGEQTAVVAYIRNMNTLDPSSVKPGNAARGKTIVEGKGECLKCHAVNDHGSIVAPDLSDIGVNRSAGALERHVLEPTFAMMPINRTVRALAKNGTVITGRRLNEDTYSLQLMNDQGRLVSVAKSDLRGFDILTTSPMPSYKGKLTTEELSDLISYLLSLKGMQ